MHRLLVTLALLAAGCTGTGRDAARRIDPNCSDDAYEVVWACSVYGRLMVCKHNTCSFTGVTAPMETPTEVP
jgi:hypothetical protein